MNDAIEKKEVNLGGKKDDHIQGAIKWEGE